MDLLPATALLAATLAILGDYAGPKALHYVAKPTATALILLVAVLDPNPLSPGYQILIAAGLACSLAGDVLLMLPRDRFVAGLVSFLAAHGFYLAAFAGETAAVTPLLALPFALALVGLLRVLWPNVGRLRVPVAIYALAIAAMAWLAASWWWASGSEAAALAAGGALLFMASDATLAINRFVHPFRAAQAIILSSYFAGQLLIALSV